jgi:hypothetical protein
MPGYKKTSNLQKSNDGITKYFDKEITLLEEVSFDI